MTSSDAGAQLSREFPLGVHRLRGELGTRAHANAAVWAPEVASLDMHYQLLDGSWRHETLMGLDGGVHHGVVGPLPVNARYVFWPTGKMLPGRAGETQLLLDPYARAIDTIHCGDTPVYCSLFVESDFDWGNSTPPRTLWRDTVIYEAHVKGLTMLHPQIPAELRGTYAGLAHPVMTDYLLSLGVTAVELLPVHFHVDEPHLEPLGLTNYWGYNTLGFFALQDQYATASARRAGPAAVLAEFKTMVKTLHEAGLEVILDVVYNHTAEAGQDRPALSWRGLGENHYYRQEHGRYLDTTGCGNTLDFSEPKVVQFTLDSLRYWAEEFQVDGFRFDLAVSLCRDENNTFTPRHPFLVAASALPALRESKLIAEPWDIGMGGWQTGCFPYGWADWNDSFRDTVRDFWLGGPASIRAGGPGGSLARLAGCLAGSADVFTPSKRSPLASINLVTSHDGFTLADLASYDRKHNEANGEENRDGHNHNRSYNHGVEGPTEDETVIAAREQTVRNLMSTLLLSLGVPMITAGDELGRTQHGNNNAYCQDNELGWVSWEQDNQAVNMLQTTRELLTIRREFLAGQPTHFPGREDSSTLLWFNAAGVPMSPQEWENPGTQTVQLLMGARGGTVNGLIVINSSLQDQKIELPAAWALQESSIRRDTRAWFQLRFSTTDVHGKHPGAQLRSGEMDSVPANSISVYQC